HAQGPAPGPRREHVADREDRRRHDRHPDREVGGGIDGLAPAEGDRERDAGEKADQRRRGIRKAVARPVAGFAAAWGHARASVRTDARSLCPSAPASDARPTSGGSRGTEPKEKKRRGCPRRFRLLRVPAYAGARSEDVADTHAEALDIRARSVSQEAFRAGAHAEGTVVVVTRGTEVRIQVGALGQRVHVGQGEGRGVGVSHVVVAKTDDLGMDAARAELHHTTDARGRVLVEAVLFTLGVAGDQAEGAEVVATTDTEALGLVGNGVLGLLEVAADVERAALVADGNVPALAGAALERFVGGFTGGVRGVDGDATERRRVVVDTVREP